MSTKVKGLTGIEFPDGTVQSSAAYSKAESDARSQLVSKVIQFTTPSSAGATVAVPHGLDATKIVSMSVFIVDSTGGANPSRILPFQSDANYAYSAFFNNGNASIRLAAGAPAGIQNQPGVFCFWSLP